MQRQQQQRAALLLLALFFSVIPSLTGGTIAADEDERPNLQRGGLEHGDYHAEMDSYDERELKCQVCKSIVDEMDFSVSQIHPGRTLDVGSGGGGGGKQVFYGRSETFLTHRLEDLCGLYSSVGVYVKAKEPWSGKTKLVRLLNRDRSANEDAYGLNIDINHNRRREDDLKFFCESAIEANDDLLIEMIQREIDTNTQKEAFCKSFCPPR